MTYNCTGCDKRSATFSSSACNESGRPIIMLALQVAFICAGCTHTQYAKVLENAIGMHVVSSFTFFVIH